MNDHYTTPPVRLSAALTDAAGRMSTAQLLTRLIVAATRHADAIGVGYRELMQHGLAWVLSRISIEMEHIPAILDTFSITTWIESFNRHISYRNFRIDGEGGRPIGYARSLWTCIDIVKRTPASLDPVELPAALECPIDPIPRLPQLATVTDTRDITVTSSDIDFNGHVNSARYVEHLYNAFSPEWIIGHRLRRIDIAYTRELLFGIPARLLLDTSRPGFIDAAITSSDAVHCRLRLTTV